MKNEKSLTAFNFGVSWDTRTCFTFLKTSNQYLFGVRLSEGVVAQWFKMPNSIWKLFWRLYSLEKRFWHTTGLLRHQKIQKKYKRPMKVVKAKSKARRWKITKVYNFFTFLGSLGFFYCMIFIFLSFKDNKAKKAALVAGKANLHWGLFLFLNVLS